jgi:uncharacterized protein YjbI with pentapeptide repeats
VDQLGQEGDNELGIRLGGIYALEALMKEFSTDQNVVTEVLCAFVRSHAPWRDEDEVIPNAQADVRAAMTVLGRRPAPDTHAPLDLSNTALGLKDFNLPSASFRDVDLSVSNLTDAKLPRADLRGSDVSRAFLERADLRGADLTGVDLTSTSLRAANLTGANLRSVNFTKADLTGADISGADLAAIPGSLTDAQLSCVKTDAATRLPTGLNAPPADAWQQPRCVVER